MTNDVDQLNAERNSLHILPLITVPLSIPSLQKARIVKNPRLEGMVELYSGQDIGSGQIHPNELGKVFDFSGEKKRDLAIVKTLSKLSSYDVYSLRIELRKLGTNVEDHENLRLSSSMTSQLSDYTHVFLKPLIDAIYGDAAKNVGSYQEMVKLFMAPRQDVARNNLVKLAKILEIPIMDIPSFLQDYGDVYLSLAYYKYCVDNYQEPLEEFLDWLHEVQQDPAARANVEFLRASQIVEEFAKGTTEEIQNTLVMFENQTSDMWDKPSAGKFQAMKRLITEYQSQIGGAVCAVTVKLDVWAQAFSSRGPGSIQSRIDFIKNEMHYGLDKIKRIAYGDVLI